MSSSSERNLLIGILALQLDFIGRDDLIDAMNSWVLDKSRPLNRILLERGALSGDTEPLLMAVVDKHLELHNACVEESLAAIAPADSLVDELSRIHDAAVDATISLIAKNQEGSGSSPSPATRRANSRDELSSRFASGSTTSPRDSQSRTSRDRYRVIRLHARGGLGEVSLARDEELNREVAVKVLQPRFAQDSFNRERFVAEAEITGSLEHPGIVPVYGLGASEDGRPFYAMRFIHGDSLRDAATKFHQQRELNTSERRLQLRNLLGRFIDVCEAIEYAHSRGVLHRDLKPGNIMIGRFGETLVVDWGLAKSIGRSESYADSDEPTVHPSSGSGSSRTELGSAVGTPAYMSPEQAAGRIDELGPASDVYGLGATLFFVLTGRPPVEGKNKQDVLERVQRGDIESLRDVSPGIARPLDAICSQAMALRPSDRYDSPHQLAEDIQRWLADAPVDAYRERIFERGSRWMRNHTTLVVASSLIGIVLIGASLSLALSADHARRRIAEEQERTEEARAVADRNFGHALDSVEQMLTRVGSDRLRAIPFMSRVRQALLEDAIAFYEETLTEEERALPSVRLRVARTNLLLGNCEHMLGNFAVAIERYRKSWEILQSLESELGSSEEHLFFMADNRQALAESLALNDDYEAALVTYNQGLKLIDSFPPEQRETFSIIRLEGKLLEGKGAVLLELGREDEGLAALEAAEGRGVKLSELAPGDEETLYALQAIAHNRAMAYSSIPEPEEAIKHYERALDYQRQLFEIEGENVWTLHDRANTLMRLGSMIAFQGETVTAIESMERSQEIFARLTSLYPGDRRYLIQYAACCHNLGEVQVSRGQNEQAIENLRKSINLLSPLLDSGELQLGELCDLANSHAALASVQVEAGDYRSARDQLQLAQELYRKLDESAPEILRYRIGFAGTFHNLADTQVFLREPEAAESNYRKSIAELDEIESEFGDSIQLCTDRANSWMMLADLLLNQNRLTESAEAFQQAEVDLLELIERQPDNLRVLRKLAASHHNRADLMWQQGDTDGAEEGYRESIRLIEPLLESYESFDLHADFANSWMRLASLLAEQERRSAADAAFLEAERRFDLVVSQAPDLPHLRMQHAATFHNRAELLRDMHRQEEAIEGFERSIKELEPLSERFPQVISVQHDLANSYLQLALTLESLQRTDEARETLVKADSFGEKIREAFPQEAAIQYMAGLIKLHYAQLSNDVDRCMQAAEQLASRDDNITNVYNAACLHALALHAVLDGRLDADEMQTTRLRDLAIDRLKRSAEMDFITVDSLLADDDLASLRGDSAFEALVKQLRSTDGSRQQDDNKDASRESQGDETANGEGTGTTS